MAPSPYWGDEPIWDSQTSMHNPMIDEQGRVWFTSRVASAGQSGLLQEGLRSSVRARCSRSTASTAICRCYDPKTGKFTLIRTCFPTHHLVFAEDANNTLWTERRRAGQRRDRLARQQDVRGDRRRGQVAGLDAVRHRHQRQRQARRMGRARTSRSIRRRTSASSAPSTASASTRRTARSGARRWTFPGYIVRVDPGREPVANRARRNLRAADAGLRAARRRHRSQRHCWASLSSGHSAASTAASARCRQRAEPRPASTARRAGRCFRSPARRSGAYRTRQRRGELLHLGRPVRHVRARRRTCRSPPATSTSRCWRWSTANGVNFVVPYPHRLLRQMDGRADRRSECRLEGQGVCGRPMARARRSISSRQGQQAEGGEVPARPDPLAK